MPDINENQNPYKFCTLCPRKCGADRTDHSDSFSSEMPKENSHNSGTLNVFQDSVPHEQRKSKSLGFCGMTDIILVSRASLHMWEEPCISGINGSGTVFFAGCSLKCVYCQNVKISRGKEIPESEILRLKDRTPGYTSVTDQAPESSNFKKENCLSSANDKALNASNLKEGNDLSPATVKDYETSNSQNRYFFSSEPDKTGNFLQLPAGKHFMELTPDELAELFLCLQSAGAHNINLVTPDHFMPGIDTALSLAKEKGLTLPIVCNVSGYESVENLEKYYRQIDIFLTDFKYMDSELAKDLSSAPNYPETAKKALKTMLDLAGEPVFASGGQDPSSQPVSGPESSHPDPPSPPVSGPESSFPDSGNNLILMTHGVIVRHLVLPGHKKNTRAVLDYLYSNYGNRIIISIMNQYTPPSSLLLCSSDQNILKKHPGLARKLTAREYENILDHALSLGIENAFIQEGKTACESFIPDF